MDKMQPSMRGRTPKRIHIITNNNNEKTKLSERNTSHSRWHTALNEQRIQGPSKDSKGHWREQNTGDNENNTEEGFLHKNPNTPQDTRNKGQHNNGNTNRRRQHGKQTQPIPGVETHNQAPRNAVQQLVQEHTQRKYHTQKSAPITIRHERGAN